MKIILEGPYSTLYRHAYLRICKDERRRVDLVNTNTDRTTVAYARYLLSVKLNRLLTDDEEADHIDEDPTNDDINNLQVLTYDDHMAKTISTRSRTFLSFICPVCNKEFLKEKRQIKPNVQEPKCSRVCNGKASRAKQSAHVSQLDRESVF